MLPGASGPTEYGFTGREPDETGLVYYRARYYEPTLGRFVSMDPAGMPDGVNRYAYVGNDPVGMVDPSGMVATVRLWNTSADISGLFPNGTLSDVPTGGLGVGVQRLPANQGQQANTWGAQDYVDNAGGAATGRQMPRVAGDRTMSAWDYTGLAVTTIGVANLPFAAASAGRWAVTTLGAAAARGTTTLYRSVSAAEHADIAASGMLRAGPNSFSTGKWFWESAESAAKFGSKMDGPGNFKIIEATFPRSATDQFMRLDRLDGIGSARFGTFEQMGTPSLRLLPP